MCGIVGFSGKQQAAPILLDGLAKLEYRGYDSAGVALVNDGIISIVKSAGRLSVLADKIDGGAAMQGFTGIGHTRWATHGAPSDINSHPHFSSGQSVAVIHNGIIENYMKIKEFLESKGCNFVSDTDTEVVAHLIEYFYVGDPLGAVTEAISHLEGSYALGVIFAQHPDEIYAVRKDSPLIVGLSDEGNYIASDIPAILKHTRETYLLNDKEIVRLTADKVELFDMFRAPIEKEIYKVDWDETAAEKDGFEHFMMKEIMEQPLALRKTISARLEDGKIRLDDFHLTAEQFENFDRIYILACGSAYHVGVVGKYILENKVRVPVEVDLASEFRYRNPIVTDKTLAIIISQSGETLDTLMAMREAKRLGARILSIVNVVGSSIARESDDVIYTWAGPEIAVATTKAYSTQLSVMYLLAEYLRELKFPSTGGVAGGMPDGVVVGDAVPGVPLEKDFILELQKLPDRVQKTLESEPEIQHLASDYFNNKSVFFLGRGVDYAVALEGSLKLKEISYIHSEAYAAGELKHGTISLIEDGTLVVALATQDELFDKVMSNIREVKARGAVVLAVAPEDKKEVEKFADHVIYIPRTLPSLMPSLAVIPLQLFGYYIALHKGCDVDKPRNLAKSVTVE